MSDIPTKYYHKELYSSPLFLRGARVAFEPVGNDEGILATEDSSLIFSLSNVISRHVGGVSEITVEAYEELKKKETPTPRLNSRSNLVRAAPTSVPHPSQPIGQQLSAYLPTRNQSPDPVVEAEKTPPPSLPDPLAERGKAAKLAKKGKAPDVTGAPPPIS